MELGVEWWRRCMIENNSSTLTNGSIDVLCANCVSMPDPLACLRSGIIAIGGIITSTIAFTRIVHHHATSSSQIRLLLYYTLCIQCIAGSFEWLLGWTTQLSLFVSYAKAIELLIIWYFYLDMVSKMMHWSSVVGKRLCFSALFMMFSYFTIFLLMGLLLSIEPWTDCHASYWIWFSAGEFAIVQLMVGSFFLILRRINRISASPNVQNNQRRDLFSLFWTFETSSLTDLGCHISLFILADDKKGCSRVFDDSQLHYSLLKGSYDIVSFLLPAWAILYVFHTPSKFSSCYDRSTESIYSSHASTTTIADVVVVRNWRRRYRPLTQHSLNDRPILSGHRSRQPGRLRAVSSAPLITSARRMSVSRSLVSSPLYSIPEELHHYDCEGPLASIDVLSTDSLIDG